MTIDRNELVKTLCYKNEYEMYNDLYNKQQLSLAVIDKRLGISSTTVCLDLKRLKIVRRSKGGFNYSMEKSVLDKLACIPLKIIQDYSISKLIKIMGLEKYQHHTQIKNYLEREFGIVKVKQTKKERPQSLCVKKPFRPTRDGTLCTVCKRKCKQAGSKPI